MHNSNDTQNAQDEEEGIKITPTIQERAQSSAANEIDIQLPSKSTDDATEEFCKYHQQKKNTKQPSTESWENAAGQCLSDLSAKYRRKINESTDQEEQSLFLKEFVA